MELTFKHVVYHIGEGCVYFCEIDQLDDTSSEFVELIKFLESLHGMAYISQSEA